MADANAHARWFQSPILATVAAALLAGLTAGVVGLTTLTVETSTRVSTLEKQLEERARGARDVLEGQEARYSERFGRASERLGDIDQRIRELELKEVQLRSFAEELKAEVDRRAGLVSRIEILEGFRRSMNAYLGRLVSDVQAKEYRRMNQEELDRRIRSYQDAADGQ